MNIQTISLDVSKAAAVPPTICIRQGDKNGTTLNVGIFDNGTALDLTSLPVRLCVKLPDGAHYYSVNGTASGNTATFEVDERYAAAYPGITDLAYVDVLDSDDVICSTQPFRLVVEPGAREGVVPSDEHIAEIDAAVERCNEAAEECESLAHPITNAQIDSITSDVAVTSDYKLTATGLTYFWGKLKAWAAGAFAAITHTHSNATDSAAGFMAAAEHTKLAGIADGAQVNSITGVKGSAESSYRTGNVSLTPANIGAANAEHGHSAANITSGTLSRTRGGTGASTAAGACENLISGQDLTPATVAATGAVSGSSISDSVGTLAALRESVNHTNAVYALSREAQANTSFVITPTLSRFQPFLILAQRSFLFVVYSGDIQKLCGGTELTITQDASTGKVTVKNNIGYPITMLILSYGLFTA